MPDTQSALRAAKGFGCAFLLFPLLLLPLTFLLALGAHGLEEECRHGFVGSGGSNEQVRTWIPPNATCESTNGERISSGGALLWVWWMGIASMVFCGLWALVLTIIGQARRITEQRAREWRP
jgi:hypothetical protein